MPIPTIAMATDQAGDRLRIDLRIGAEVVSVSRFLSDPSSARFRIDRTEIAGMLHELAFALENG